MTEQIKTIKAEKHIPMHWNVISNWLLLALNVVIGFVLTPILYSHLGPDRFGIWALATSVTGYFGFLQLGVGTGILRYVAVSRGGPQKEKISEVVSTGMYFYVAVGLAVLILSFLLAGPIGNFYQTDGKAFTMLIKIMGIGLALECLMLVLDHTLRAYEKFVFINLAGSIKVLVRSGIIIMCVFMGFGLVELGFAQLIATSIGLFLVFGVYKSFSGQIKISPKFFSITLLGSLIAYGIATTIEGMATSLLTLGSPRLVLGKVVSLQAVGYLAVVYRLLQYYRRAIRASANVLLPRFGYLFGKEDMEKIRNLFLLSTRHITTMASMIALVLFTIGPRFMLLWIGDENILAVKPALIIMTIGTVVLASQRSSFELFYGAGKQKMLTLFAVTEGCSVLILSLLLSFRYQITGVAIAFALPMVLVRGIVQPVFVCRYLKISFFSYYRVSLIGPWAGVLILSAIFYLLKLNQHINSWLSLIAAGCVIVATFCIPAFFLFLNKSERKKLLNKLFKRTKIQVE